MLSPGLQSRKRRELFNDDDIIRASCSMATSRASFFLLSTSRVDFLFHLIKGWKIVSIFRLFIAIDFRDLVSGLRDSISIMLA